MLQRVLALLAVAALLAALLVYSQYRPEPRKVSGFIEADEIRVGSRVGGRVASVHVAEGEEASLGEVLVKLEPFDLQNRLAQAVSEAAARKAEYEKLQAGFREEEIAQAKAQHEQALANLEKLERGPRDEEIAAARAAVRLANAQLEAAQTRFARTEKLYERGAVTREVYDQDFKDRRVAEETVNARTEELNALLEGTRPEDLAQARARVEEARQAWLLRKNGYRSEEIAQAKAALEAAEAAVRVIEDQIEELTIRAPSASVVEAIELQPGDLVPAGAPVISLADRSRLWVRAYVPEDWLSIQIGQKVNVTVDSFPGQVFAGHVSFIAREAEFRPGNVQTPEERSKQVFRIKVELDEGLGELRPGMIGDVWLEDRP
jgi:multidrug resistance efflux pump